MKPIRRSATPDGERKFLDAFPDSDSRLATNDAEAIARIEILAEQGYLVLDKRARSALIKSAQQPQAGRKLERPKNSC